MAINPLIEGLMQMVGSRFGVLVNRMADEQPISSIPRPISVCCSPNVRLSSERTVTGKRIRLHGCLELSNNLHISIAGNCMRESGNWIEQLSRASVPLPLSQLANVSLGLQNSSRSPASNERMPRLRHRMRCRRGSSRRLIRRSSPSSSTSAADSHASERTSRAARGRILRSGQRYPTPPHAPAHSQTRHFTFQSALNCPRITASVTIVFHESPQDEAPNSGRRAGNVGDMTDIRQNADGVHEQDMDITQEDTSHGNEMHIDIDLKQHEQQTDTQDPGTKDAQHQTQPRDAKRTPAAEKVIHSTEDLYTTDGEPDDLWCRVVEEEPDE